MVGNTYYFITHAYYHYIATVVEVLGTRRVSVTNVVQVHSCQRGWTEFFRDGFKKDTKYDLLPDCPDLSYIVPFVWKHPIPKEKS